MKINPAMCAKGTASKLPALCQGTTPSLPILRQRHSLKPTCFVPGYNTEPVQFVPRGQHQTWLQSAEPQHCLPEGGMPRAHPVPSPSQELAAQLPLLLVLTIAKPFWHFCTWHQPLAEGSPDLRAHVWDRHNPANRAWASSVLINQLSVNILSV